MRLRKETWLVKKKSITQLYERQRKQKFAVVSLHRGTSGPEDIPDSNKTADASSYREDYKM